MRNGLPEFRPRQPLDRQLSAATLNDIRKELESLRITRVVGGTFRKLPGGTEIVVSTQRGGGSANHPFQIRSSKKPSQDEEESNEYIVTVSPGTINSLLPAEIFDGESIKQHTIPKDSLRHVVLQAQSDGQQITAASISLETTAPQPQEPVVFGLPAQADFLIGVVYNSSVYQVITDNISVTGKQQFVTEKIAPAQPGELPYEIHYVWG